MAVYDIFNEEEDKDSKTESLAPRQTPKVDIQSRIQQRVFGGIGTPETAAEKFGYGALAGALDAASFGYATGEEGIWKHPITGEQIDPGISGSVGAMVGYGVGEAPYMFAGGVALGPVAARALARAGVKAAVKPGLSYGRRVIQTLKSGTTLAESATGAAIETARTAVAAATGDEVEVNSALYRIPIAFAAPSILRGIPRPKIKMLKAAKAYKEVTQAAPEAGLPGWVKSAKRKGIYGSRTALNVKEINELNIAGDLLNMSRKPFSLGEEATELVNETTDIISKSPIFHSSAIKGTRFVRLAHIRNCLGSIYGGLERQGDNGVEMAQRAMRAVQESATKAGTAWTKVQKTFDVLTDYQYRQVMVYSDGGPDAFLREFVGAVKAKGFEGVVISPDNELAAMSNLLDEKVMKALTTWATERGKVEGGLINLGTAIRTTAGTWTPLEKRLEKWYWPHYYNWEKIIKDLDSLSPAERTRGQERMIELARRKLIDENAFAKQIGAPEKAVPTSISYDTAKGILMAEKTQPLSSSLHARQTNLPFWQGYPYKGVKFDRKAADTTLQMYFDDQYRVMATLKYFGTRDLKDMPVYGEFGLINTLPVVRRMEKRLGDAMNIVDEIEILKKFLRPHRGALKYSDSELRKMIGESIVEYERVVGRPFPLQEGRLKVEFRIVEPDDRIRIPSYQSYTLTSSRGAAFTHSREKYPIIALNADYLRGKHIDSSRKAIAETIAHELAHIAQARGHEDALDKFAEKSMSFFRWTLKRRGLSKEPGAYAVQIASKFRGKAAVRETALATQKAAGVSKGVSSTYRTLLEGIKADGYDDEFARLAMDKLMGISPYAPRATAISQTARTVGILSELGLAGVDNISQSTLTATAYGWTRTVTQMVRMLDKQSRKDMTEFAISSGAISRDILRNSELMVSGNAAKLFLKYTGFSSIEQYNRVIASNAAVGWFSYGLEMIAKNPGSQRANAFWRQIDYMGVTEKQLSRWGITKVGGVSGKAGTALLKTIKSGDSKALQTEIMKTLGYQGSRATQFLAGVLDNPSFAASPWGRDDRLCVD